MPLSRARIAPALAVVTIGAATALVALAPARAAEPDATVAAWPAVVAEPVTTSNGTHTLIVDPTTGLPAANATITVQGTGFDTGQGLYVAVCADRSGAPADLTSCVGGSIPDRNTTTAWGHITKNGKGTGGVKAAWGPDGSFSVRLALQSVTDGDVNCVTSKCSIYTASDDNTIRTEDSAVPLNFASAPPSTSTPPGTAIPQNISAPTIVAGGTQNVIFSGFEAGEQVNLTLFSAPITLSPVTADQTGVATVAFIVPADFVAGTHRLEAIGAQSGTVGVASFQVTAPPVPSSLSPTSSPAPSSSASSSPAASSSAASSSAPASSAVTSSSPAAASGGDSGSSLWLLWLILAIVLIAGIITGVLVYRRNQQEQRERDEMEIADSVAREQQVGAGDGSNFDAQTVFLPPVQPDGPPPGADPYGLLSGRDHPDNPSLYSGHDPSGPTQAYGSPPGHGGPPPGGPAGSSGPPTEAMPPTRPGSRGADGPGTQAWSQDSDDTDTDTDRGSSGDGSSDGGSR